MVLRTKLWFYTENYGISINKENKNMIDYQKQKKNWISVEKYGTIPKQLTILKKKI